VSRELSPRFSSLFRYYSLQKSPRCHSRFSLPILLKAVGYSLLLEDCSSVEVIVVDSSPETTGVKTFCVVEIMYLLWKCRPAPTRTSRPRLYHAGLMIPMHSLSRDSHRCSERPWSITQVWCRKREAVHAGIEMGRNNDGEGAVYAGFDRTENPGAGPLRFTQPNFPN
jgi:hypothetical protein